MPRSTGQSGDETPVSQQTYKLSRSYLQLNSRDEQYAAQRMKLRDIYRCPAAETLTFRFDTVEKGRHIRYYRISACRRCTLKEKCTRNKEGRWITRWIHEEVIEQTQQRVQAHPEIMEQRRQIVEHPFGTIKHWWDHNHFLMRGPEKVRAEFSLSALAYNITRMINILGVNTLIAFLKARPDRLIWA